jgi:molecular chaperone GrpE (heat shock protein)
MTVIDPAEITAISDRLDHLGKLFETKIIEAERQQHWVTQLTSELAEYRNDFVFKNVLSRVFRDLIQLHDALNQTLDPATVEEITREELLARLRHLQKQLLKTFDRQGLEQISSDALTRFNEDEQEAIDVQPVDHPEKDGIVVESARCGFRYGLRLLRPESVIIGRYEPRDEEADA